jgi:protein MpaA
VRASLGVGALAAALACALAVPAPAADPEPLPGGATVLLGRSVQHRAITAVRVGDRTAARRALVVGVIHGNERAGLRVTRALRKLGGATGLDLWVVDTVNPDGVAHGTRRNARGVDLNRNFSRRWRPTGGPGSGYYAGARPFSERESRIVRRWIERIHPAVTIWYHQPWGAVLLPCRGSAPAEERYAELARFPAKRCLGDRLPGTATKWQNHELPGTHAFVVELPAAPISAKSVRRHARAALRVAAGG